MLNPSNEQKIYELSLIWKEVEYNFAFWDNINKDIDWDQEYKIALKKVLSTDNLFDYYLELKRFVSLLKDGHTDVSFPSEIYDSPKYNSSLPVSFGYINGEYYVMAVKECVKDKIRVFSKILKINDINVHDYIKDNIFPYIWHEKIDSCAYHLFNLLHMGENGSKVKLTLEFETKQYEVVISRTFKDYSWCKRPSLLCDEFNDNLEFKTHSIHVTKDNIAVIKINSFGDNEFPTELFGNFDLLKKAKGYIIDIRNNGGGNSDNALALAGLFIGKEFLSDVMKYPVHYGPFKAWATQVSFGDKTWDEVKEEVGNSKWWEKVYKVHKHEFFEETTSSANLPNLPGKLNGPIVILCSEQTASSAENFILYMKHHTNSIIVGNNTYGSTGLPLPIKLDSGGNFRVCTQHCFELNGNEFINIGITPDVKCINTIDDYKKEFDNVFKKGLDIIRNS